MCVDKVKERTYKNYAATERTYEITFDSDWQGANLKDVRQEMGNMFENVLKDATTGMSGSDRGRVMLDHSSLNSPLVVPLQKLDTLNADTVMEAVENCLNSQESLTVDTSFNLNIGIIEIPKGSGSNYNPGSGGHGHRTHALSEADLFKKRTVWWNRSFDDHLCLHRAVAVALSKFWTVSDKEWRTLAGTDRSLDSMIRQRKFPRKTYEHMIEKNSQGTKRLQKFSQCLSDVAHVPTDTPGTLDTLLLYSNYFNVHFNVIDMDQGRVFVTPPNPDLQTTPNLYLVRCNNHWGTITSIQGFFCSSYFCESCRQPFKSYKSHKCSTTCGVCLNTDCTRDNGAEIVCQLCNQTCRSVACLDRHTQKKNIICDRVWKCLECNVLVDLCYSKDLGKNLRMQKDHRCAETKCVCCQRWVLQPHHCFMRSTDKQVGALKIIHFDFECRQEDMHECADGYSPHNISGIDCETCESWGHSRCGTCRKCDNCHERACGFLEHKPNLVVAQSSCDVCWERDVTANDKCESCGSRCIKCHTWNRKEKRFAGPPCNTCGFRQVSFTGNKTCEDFGEWLFSKAHTKYIAMAHNLKGT